MFRYGLGIFNDFQKVLYLLLANKLESREIDKMSKHVVWPLGAIIYSTVVLSLHQILQSRSKTDLRYDFICNIPVVFNFMVSLSVLSDHFSSSCVFHFFTYRLIVVASRIGYNVFRMKTVLFSSSWMIHSLLIPTTMPIQGPRLSGRNSWYPSETDSGAAAW